MAEYGFTPEQEMLRAEVRRFAQRELAPGVKDRRKLSNEEYDEALRPIREKVVKMGWTALGCPAKYGGRPVDYTSVGIMFEEIDRVEPASGVGGNANILASHDLQYLGEEVQDEWYPPLINLTAKHAHAWTEPGAGSDVAGIQTRAVRQGDYYVITGEKQPITQGTVAGVATVVTKTDPSAGHRGLTQFWVPLDLPGITRVPVEQMGRRRDRQGIIVFDEVRLPAKYRIGKEGEGFYQMMGQFDWFRPCVALGNLAVAQTSLEETMAWAKQRSTFGRPIASFQGVSFQIAEHYTRLHAARLVCYHALWLADQGLPHAKESAMSKWFGHETAVHALHDCMIIFGHVGYSQDCPIEERLRDVVGHEIGGGTPHIQKMIIARELLGREATR